MRYKVMWDNGHASGVFDYVFDTEDEAAAWARDWKREMVAIETTPAARREARVAYAWEVIEAAEEGKE